MIFPGSPGILLLFQVFQDEWEPRNYDSHRILQKKNYQWMETKVTVGCVWIIIQKCN